MPTIKDVAAAAGVSPTTVSLVMNGRGEQHRIPADTIARIQNAMRELGYQPNLSARRLRSSAERKPVIAFFWPLDYRANMLGHFLSLIQTALHEKNYDCELVVHPYTHDHIADACGALIHNNYTGAIIGAASEADVRHLETLRKQQVQHLQRQLQQSRSAGRQPDTAEKLPPSRYYLFRLSLPCHQPPHRCLYLRLQAAGHPGPTGVGLYRPQHPRGRRHRRREPVCPDQYAQDGAV